MVNVPFHSYKIEDRSYVSFAKRSIHSLVANVFPESRAGEIDIVVAELTSNLIKYAGSGELLYRLSEDNGDPLFELICIDSGPGISDMNHSRRDGVSSGNSLGQGIGSVTRLANFAQFYSLPDWGTIVYVRFRVSDEYQEPSLHLAWRCINVALHGETVSGDISAMKVANNQPAFLVFDGLGHGENANIAAKTAAESFLAAKTMDPSELIREINTPVRKTRGGVGMIITGNFPAKSWEICGVGNISVRVYNGLEHRSYITNNGIIGMTLPSRLYNLTVPMAKFQQVVMASDGIRTKWTLLKYTGILKYDPMILAAALYKDESRGTDDTTILIVKVL